jgi:hypothetical protein
MDDEFGLSTVIIAANNIHFQMKLPQRILKMLRSATFLAFILQDLFVGYRKTSQIVIIL